jgi:hypothetical protein
MFFKINDNTLKIKLNEWFSSSLTLANAYKVFLNKIKDILAVTYGKHKIPLGSRWIKGVQAAGTPGQIADAIDVPYNTLDEKMFEYKKTENPVNDETKLIALKNNNDRIKRDIDKLLKPDLKQLFTRELTIEDKKQLKTNLLGNDSFNKEQNIELLDDITRWVKFSVAFSALSV